MAANENDPSPVPSPDGPDFGYPDKIAAGVRRECETALGDGDDGDVCVDAGDVVCLLDSYDHLRSRAGGVGGVLAMLERRGVITTDPAKAERCCGERDEDGFCPHRDYHPIYVPAGGAASPQVQS